MQRIKFFNIINGNAYCSRIRHFFLLLLQNSFMKREPIKPDPAKLQAEVNKAHKEADKDIAKDPDNIHSPNDDLDEGELSRLGENPDGI